MRIVPHALKQVIEEGMTGLLPVIRDTAVSGSLSGGPVREVTERFVTARGVPAIRHLRQCRGLTGHSKMGTIPGLVLMN